MNYNDFDILFAEDSADDAMLTIRTLKKAGLTNTVFHVKDGSEALDFLYGVGVFASRNTHLRPLLVLLDLKMPKVSGTEVLKKIKSDPSFRSTPVIILTPSKEDPDIKQCYELGANSYIVKPVESDKFFQAIKELGVYWMILNTSSSC